MEARGVVTICLLFLYLGIFTPTIVFYFIKYALYHMQSESYARRRHFPIVCIFQFFVLILVGINRPMHSITTISDWVSDDTTEKISRFFFVFALYGILLTFLWRVWILFYDTQLNQLAENREWKKALSPEHYRSDWYRLHRKTLGNPAYIGYRFAVLWVCIVSAHYSIFIFFGHSKAEFAMQFTVCALIAFCLASIFYRVSKHRDVFGISLELRLMIYSCLLICVVFILSVAVGKENSHKWFWLATEDAIYASCSTAMTLVSTAWVLWYHEHHSKLRIGKKLSGKRIHSAEAKARQKATPASAEAVAATIVPGGNTPVTPSAAAAAHAGDFDTDITMADSNVLPPNAPAKVQTISIDVHSIDDAQSSSKVPLSPKTARMVSEFAHAASSEQKFNYCMSREQYFLMFMGHIKREYSMENMLALIEFIQFEDFIIATMDESDARSQFTKTYNFEFYPTLPKSLIVYDAKDDIWTKTRKLYEKYVECEAIYQLNLRYTIQQKWKSLINDISGQKATVNLFQVLDTTEELLAGLMTLLYDSFSRFDGTVDYALCDLNDAISYSSPVGEDNPNKNQWNP